MRESERLTRLINDFLDLSKIEFGKMEWHLCTCELREVMRDAIAATHGLFAERQVRLTQELVGGAASAVCDRDRLVQVLVNLLSNAVKFVPEGSGLGPCRAAAAR